MAPRALVAMSFRFLTLFLLARTGRMMAPLSTGRMTVPATSTGTLDSSMLTISQSLLELTPLTFLDGEVGTATVALSMISASSMAAAASSTLPWFSSSMASAIRRSASSLAAFRARSSASLRLRSCSARYPPAAFLMTASALVRGSIFIFMAFSLLSIRCTSMANTGTSRIFLQWYPSAI